MSKMPFLLVLRLPFWRGRFISVTVVLGRA